MKSIYKKGSASSQDGFTLIELLVVIAIIGVLSSVLLNSLSASRAKAADAKVKQQLNGFRRAAELYYSNQTPNSYGVSTAVCTAGMFADPAPANGNPNAYIAIWTGITTPTRYCQSNGTQYAVKASISTGGWCVDSTNKSVSITPAQLAAGPAVVCP